MPDPVPKPAAQRRRRNVDRSAKALVGAPAARLVLPVEALPATVAWWDAIWSSPMAGVWLDSDAHALLRLAALVDRANQGKAGGLVLGEIRMLEDRFGLSPLARRRLQWEVSQVAPAAVDVEPEDGSRWLHAVSD